ncbi:MAG: DUF58 domain-containing protein [Gemmataceae bacterium]|nr:DUF58 domain-containing protein [Gemmataceae bacterium]MCI0741072.1 DUF58 domain-containing protein [Gemmataceae bacterium]
MSSSLRQALLEGERAGSHYVLTTPRGLPLGTVGPHQGARTGSSLEFREHRDYQPGDDLRYVDWSVYARSDKLVVKLYHEEVTPHLDIVVDSSRSMALAGTTKAEAAVGLAAFFAVAAENAGMTQKLWWAGDGCAQPPACQGRAHTWDLPAFDFAASFAESFARRPPLFRPRGLRVLLSDLLWLGDPMHVLAPCADRATATIVLQILADADVRPPERGNLRLLDVESGQTLELLVDDAAARRYGAALERHESNWREACRRVGAIMTIVVAEEWLEERRLDELVAAEVLQVL